MRNIVGNILIKTTASLSSYKLGLLGEKDFSRYSRILWKMDIVKMTHFGNFEKIAWKWLKWRGKPVPKQFCGYFSHPLVVFKASPLDEVLGPADFTLETQAKNCSDPFCNH